MARTATTAKKTAPAEGKMKRKAQAPAKATDKTVEKNVAAAKQDPSYGLRAAPTAEGKRRTGFDESSLVKIEVQDNPKRPGTGAFNRFMQYQSLAAKHGNGKFTVKQVLDAGVQPSDIRYNVKHGYISLKDGEKPEPAKKDA